MKNNITLDTYFNVAIWLILLAKLGIMDKQSVNNKIFVQFWLRFWYQTYVFGLDFQGTAGYLVRCFKSFGDFIDNVTMGLKLNQVLLSIIEFWVIKTD